MTPIDFSTVLPEITLALVAMAALLGVVYTGKDALASSLNWGMAGVFVILAFWIGVGTSGERVAFDGMFNDDPFARFAKVTILLSAAAVLVISHDYMVKRGLMRFEYPILIALSVLGMMFMVSAGDLIALYMGLELQSLALYVVASLRRDSVKSSEAGLKYFVLGSLSSGILLYGASLTYGYAGTTDFAGILSTLGHGDVPLGLVFGLVFLITGLAFKVSAVPFHMWTPDVYEGSPTPVTAFFATAPKVAAMGLLARLMYDAFGAIPGQWGQVIAVLAVLSMFVGAIAAIGQRDIKRLMAYSSISHMGFALIGLASGTVFGVQAMLIYVVIYVSMNIGTFAFILSMERDGVPVTTIDGLNMLSKKAPLQALAMLVLLFSLAGVPPMLGFFGKFYVLQAAVKADMTWLAVSGAVASVIGAFYYLRVVFFMYFGKEGAGIDAQMGRVQWLALMGSAAVMVFGIINLFGVEGVAQIAAEALVR
ncbi:NADH-quinone oxidoreductase subunit NuoN [Pseudorhodobacter turbinis]|uniref:NADH-quinone oxidoreductase subunit N n=1 Tax=Pseudorhodobacter turbinis TaxID=2500533 RepID=A0A4P8EDN9_9RHOB|nr:NADH-quinone oxidoreductase subunit NuoN [Pseudorhodobacter turbinis]QCO54936.1 NADH-quinone oxidoreductase subunit NuoN [Pseudorhodobacter turbinis]